MRKKPYSKRIPKEYQCWICGKLFPATRCTAHLCSPKCRTRISRARRDGSEILVQQCPKRLIIIPREKQRPRLGKEARRLAEAEAEQLGHAEAPGPGHAKGGSRKCTGSTRRTAGRSR